MSEEVNLPSRSEYFCEILKIGDFGGRLWVDKCGGYPGGVVEKEAEG